MSGLSERQTARRLLLLDKRRPSWLLAAGGITSQIDWDTGRGYLNGVPYYDEASLKGLFSTFSTPACYVTDTAGVLKLMPANSWHTFYGGSDRGQLIEEARTNLLTYSQVVNNWTVKTDLTINDNFIAAPDGTTTAARVVAGTAGSDTLITNQGTITSTASIVQSVFLKKLSSQWLRVVFQSSDGVDGFNQWIDLTNGVLGTSSIRGAGTRTSVELVTLANGWFWLKMVGKVGIKTAANLAVVSAASDGSSTRVNNASYYIWQADLNDGATFVTSPIPTTSSSATRAASSIIANDGTPLAAAAQQAKAMLFQTDGVTGGTAPFMLAFPTPKAAFYFSNSTTARATDGAQTAVGTLGSGTYAGVVKSAFGMDASSFTARANGGSVGTQATPWGGNTGHVYFGDSDGHTRALNGYLTRTAFGSVKGAFDGLTA